MRFTATFLSLLLSVTAVVAQIDGDEPTCEDGDGGPNDGDKAAVLNAFLARYAPDGFYRPQGTYFLCSSMSIDVPRLDL